MRTTEKFRDQFAQHKEDAKYFRSVASELTEHVEELTGEEGGAQKYAELKHNLALSQQVLIISISEIFRTCHSLIVLVCVGGSYSK